MHNIQLEYDLLSIILNSDSNEKISKYISEAESNIFYNNKLRAIFSGCQRLIQEQKQIEDSLLTHNVGIHDSSLFDSEDEISILITSIKAREIKDVAYKNILDTLTDLFKRREINKDLSNLKTKIEDESKPLSEIEIDYKNLSIFSNKQDYIISPGDIKKKRLEGLNDRTKFGIGYFTGFPNLDKHLTMGFVPGMSVIAGRTNIGKSMFKSNLILNLLNAGAGVVSVCLEQDFQIEMDRFTSIESGIPLKDMIGVYKWAKNDKRIKDVINFTKVMDRFNLHFIDKRSMSMTELINITNMLNNHHKVDIVFVDLFDRLQEVQTENNKAEKISNLLPVLAEWGRVLKVHFCLITQIRQDVDRRKDKRPGLGDIRSSSAFSEFVEVAFMLYRDDYYNDEIFDAPFEVKIAKQKQGPQNEVGEFDWDRSTLKLTPRII